MEIRIFEIEASAYTTDSVDYRGNPLEILDHVGTLKSLTLEGLYEAMARCKINSRYNYELGLIREVTVHQTYEPPEDWLEKTKVFEQYQIDRQKKIDDAAEVRRRQEEINKRDREIIERRQLSALKQKYPDES